MLGLDRRTLAVILGVLLLRWLLLALAPLELIADEAHYWEWSRRPDWSYATKGPGVAWIIAVSTAIFGDTEFGVRFFSPVFGAIAAFALARTAKGLTGSDRSAFWTALLATTALPFAGLHLLLTIDSPLFAAYAVALAASERIFASRERGPAPLATYAVLGAALGLGFIAKYAILLFLPGFLWHARQERAKLPGLGLAIVALGLGAGLLPVIVWNAENEWIAIQHLLGHLHVPGGDRPPRPIEPWVTVPGYLGWQVLFFAPLIAILVRTSEATAGAPATRFLVRAALPSFLFYGLVAIKTKVQPNWPLTGWLPLVVLGGVGLAAAARQPARLWPIARTLRSAAGLQVAVFGLAMLIAAVMPAIASSEALRRSFRPLARTQGHSERAAEVEALRQAVRARTGQEPVLIAQRYTVASLLAFYLPGHPVLLCAQHALGGRRTPYDDFEDTALDHPAWRGRPAILLGGDPERWQALFRGPLLKPEPPTEGALLLERYEGPR